MTCSRDLGERLGPLHVDPMGDWRDKATAERNAHPARALDVENARTQDPASPCERHRESGSGRQNHCRTQRSHQAAGEEAVPDKIPDASRRRSMSEEDPLSVEEADVGAADRDPYAREPTPDAFQAGELEEMPAGIGHKQYADAVVPISPPQADRLGGSCGQPKWRLLTSKVVMDAWLLNTRQPQERGCQPCQCRTGPRRYHRG